MEEPDQIGMRVTVANGQRHGGSRAVRVIAVAVVVLLGACSSASSSTGSSGSGGSSDSDAIPTTAPALARGIYHGTGTVVLTRYDYCGAHAGREQIGSSTMQFPATLSIDAPLTGEGNVFNLSLVVGTTGAIGSTTLKSALPGTPSPRVYWNYQLNGSSLDGSLVDNGESDGQSSNVVTAPAPASGCTPEGVVVPFDGFDVGARITGTIDRATANLTITGTGISQYWSATVTVTATRS